MYKVKLYTAARAAQDKLDLLYVNAHIIDAKTALEIGRLGAWGLPDDETDTISAIPKCSVLRVAQFFIQHEGTSRRRGAGSHLLQAFLNTVNDRDVTDTQFVTADVENAAVIHMLEKITPGAATYTEDEFSHDPMSPHAAISLLEQRHAQLELLQLQGREPSDSFALAINTTLDLNTIDMNNWPEARVVPMPVIPQ